MPKINYTPREINISPGRVFGFLWHCDISLLFASSLYFSGLCFVRGRPLHFRTGDPSVQGQSLFRVTATAQASRETPPAVQ